VRVDPAEVPEAEATSEVRGRQTVAPNTSLPVPDPASARGRRRSGRLSTRLTLVGQSFDGGTSFLAQMHGERASFGGSHCVCLMGGAAGGGSARCRFAGHGRRGGDRPCGVAVDRCSRAASGVEVGAGGQQVADHGAVDRNRERRRMGGGAAVAPRSQRSHRAVAATRLRAHGTSCAPRASWPSHGRRSQSATGPRPPIRSSMRAMQALAQSIAIRSSSPFTSPPSIPRPG